jgi:serine/threonine protein kinase
MEPLGREDPKEIGGYRLVCLLGRGGMGRVYLGHSWAGKAAAVKVIKPEHAHDRYFLARFSREVEAAKRVSGAYTASVLGAGPNDTPPWLATEFVPGPSLAEAVAQAGRLPLDAVWRLAAGLVEALSEVHASGLVHRDLKPANVMLAANGPKVIDFGISRSLASAEQARQGDTYPGLTIPGKGSPGTPGFMSPEQYSGERIGPESDIYSLGKVIAYGATGAIVTVDGAETSAAAFGGTRRTSLAEVPGELRGLVASCLTLLPENRPPLPELMRSVMTRAQRFPQPSSLSFWREPLASLVRAKEADLERRLGAGAIGLGTRSDRSPRGSVPHPPTLLSGATRQDSVYWKDTQTYRSAGAQVRRPPSRVRPDPAINRGLTGGLFAAYRPRPRRESAVRRPGGLKDAAAFALEAEKLFDKRRFTEAVDAYLSSIELDEKNPVVHVDLGCTLFAQRRGMDAEASFLRALDLDWLLIAAHRDRCVTLYMMGGRSNDLSEAREQAEAACEDVIRSAAEDPAGLANQGDAYCCLNRHRDAARAYRKALTLDDGNPRLLAKLGYARRQGG